MSQAARQHAEPINADSFLDIVASVVCIMLIMVLMIGMRIKNTPLETLLGTGEPDEQLTAAETVEHRLTEDVLRAEAQVETLGKEAANRALQREILATAVAAMEHEIEARREKMDAEGRADFDLQRRIAEYKRGLEDIQWRKTQTETSAPPSVVIESYPTPISRVVDDHELHFHLRDGYLAYVPLEDLVKRCGADAQQHVERLLDKDEFTRTIGPEGGFRLRYTVAKKEADLGLGRSRAYGRLEQAELLPESRPLGEPVAAALAQGSEFRKLLARSRPGDHTITIWVYPDSFDSFRAIRKELFRLGFAVAARPLPESEHISISPDGSKSAAQ